MQQPIAFDLSLLLASIKINQPLAIDAMAATFDLSPNTVTCFTQLWSLQSTMLDCLVPSIFSPFHPPGAESVKQRLMQIETFFMNCCRLHLVKAIHD